MVWLSHRCMTTGKAIALTMWTFVSKMMSLLFNTLSKFDIAFLPRSKCLNFMVAVTICNDFGAQGNKIYHCFHFSPSICHEVMGQETMILVFWMLSFKPAFSLLSPSSRGSLVPLHFLPLQWYHLHIWGCYFSQQYWFQFMIYSALYFTWCNLHVNKQDHNIKPCHTSFPISNQSVVPCKVLMVAFWPTYRFLRRQVRWSGIPTSLRVFYSLLWSTQSQAFM